MADPVKYVELTTEQAVEAVVNGAWLVRAGIPDLRALLQGIDQVVKGRNLSLSKVELHLWECRIDACRCRGLRILHSLEVSSATFTQDADFILATFSQNADFHDAKFPLAGQDQGMADFTRTATGRADFRFTDLTGVSVCLADLTHARGLFGRGRAKLDDVLDAEWAIYAPRWDRVPWALLRSIGTLRLFGASYAALIVIVCYAYFGHWYNRTAPEAIDATRQAGALAVEAVGRQPEGNAATGPGPSAGFVDRAIDRGLDRVADRVCDRLTERIEVVGHAVAGDDDRLQAWLGRIEHLPLPEHLRRQLVAIVLLAIGATLYAVFCPEVVKEATETRWTRQLGQPLIEYRSAMYYRRTLRYVCAFCYASGGLYTLGYLALRVYYAVTFLGSA